MANGLSTIILKTTTATIAKTLALRNSGLEKAFDATGHSILTLEVSLSTVFQT